VRTARKWQLPPHCGPQSGPDGALIQDSQDGSCIPHAVADYWAWFKNGDSPPSQPSTTTQKTGSGEVPVPVFHADYCCCVSPAGAEPDSGTVPVAVGGGSYERIFRVVAPWDFGSSVEDENDGGS